MSSDKARGISNAWAVVLWVAILAGLTAFWGAVAGVALFG